MSEDTTIEATDEVLKGYGQLFAQLLESQRFKDFLGIYYTLQKFVDDGEKTVTFQIIENSPEIIADKLKAKVIEEHSKIQIASPGLHTTSHSPVFNTRKRKHGKI